MQRTPFPGHNHDASMSSAAAPAVHLVSARELEVEFAEPRDLAPAIIERDGVRQLFLEDMAGAELGARVNVMLQVGWRERRMIRLQATVSWRRATARAGLPAGTALDIVDAKAWVRLRALADDRSTTTH